MNIPSDPNEVPEVEDDIVDEDDLDEDISDDDDETDVEREVRERQEDKSDSLEKD